MCTFIFVGVGVRCIFMRKEGFPASFLITIIVISSSMRPLFFDQFTKKNECVRISNFFPWFPDWQTHSHVDMKGFLSSKSFACSFKQINVTHAHAHWQTLLGKKQIEKSCGSFTFEHTHKTPTCTNKTNKLSMFRRKKNMKENKRPKLQWAKQWTEQRRQSYENVCAVYIVLWVLMSSRQARIKERMSQQKNIDTKLEICFMFCVFVYTVCRKLVNKRKTQRVNWTIWTFCFPTNSVCSITSRDLFRFHHCVQCARILITSWIFCVATYRPRIVQSSKRNLCDKPKEKQQNWNIKYWSDFVASSSERRDDGPRQRKILNHKQQFV